ncbi:MAG: DNA-binding response regulator [Gammaproteobacteria bacterium RBG_16_57_12]|nr:MAG: DNA-binding response regulator [Gammaproteobacteria bacterium RBG_16_57_12]
MRLLLVEDDELLGDGIRVALTQEGYAVDWVKDGAAAQAALGVGNYDIAILDIGLPKISGLDVLKAIRNKKIDTPVMMLTARDTVQDRVAGLDRGADDYMIKPFDVDELSARLRALIRRQGGRASPLITHGNITLDPASHTVTRDGEALELPRREFAILQLLLEHAGKVMSRARLEESLYSWDDSVESNAIEVYIHHLRKKLGTEFIRTIRGIGYIVDKK